MFYSKNGNDRKATIYLTCGAEKIGDMVIKKKYRKIKRIVDSYFEKMSSIISFYFNS